ncbi:MAG: hypothetical protein HYY18_02395 [Planctomycetes bacterium]|nr:hypothetical protein [Planctomycetota bacterium]
MKAILGFLAGAALAAAALAGVGRLRVQGEAALADGAAAPEAAAEDLKPLREALAAAEAELAGLPPEPEARDRAASEALAYGRSLGDGIGTPGPVAAAKRVLHLLNRARFEHLLSDEEMLCHPDRDRMAAAFLDGRGLPLSPDQRHRLDELLMFEEASWRDLLSARRKQTPLERAAASLELAAKEEDWLNSILSVEQQTALAACVEGDRPEDSVVVVGRRRGGWGETFDAASETAGGGLSEAWGSEILGMAGQGVRFRDFADEYAGEIAALGCASDDGSGNIPLAWRKRQAAIQAALQKKMLADERWDEEERAAIRRWQTGYVWVK